MRSNNNDVTVVDAIDYGSGGGGLAQLRPDRCGGRIRQRPDRTAGASGSGRIGGGSRSSTTTAWMLHRGGRLMRERHPSTTRRRGEWSCVGGQCRWRSDGELRSADGLTRRSGGWINRIGRLTRGTTLGGVEIDLPGGGTDEGSGRL
jgi:hypothetical protein